MSMNIPSLEDFIAQNPVEFSDVVQQKGKDPKDIPSLEEFTKTLEQEEETPKKLETVKGDFDGLPSLEDFAKDNGLEFQGDYEPKESKQEPVKDKDIPSLEKFIHDLTLATDPSEIPFVLGKQKVAGLTELVSGDSRIKVYGKNPNEMGEVITTYINNPTGNKPNVKTVTDAWLNKWNPEYVELNERFRKETGGLSIALLDDRRNWKFMEGNKLEISGRPTRAVQSLFQAYKEGGLPAFNATNALINQQLNSAVIEYETNKKMLDDLEKKHPWMAAAASGIEHEAKNIVQLGTNLKYLDKAFAVGSHYGYDSQQYLDLINQEAEEQDYLQAVEGRIYSPPSFAGKVAAGVSSGALMLPRIMVAGKVLGPMSLPLMTYAGELHRGNRGAATEALKMAILVGSGRGLAKFTDVNPLGSSAPFRRISKADLSIMQRTVIQGESVSIKQLTPLERQLIHRGANALSLQLPIDGATIQDVAANMVVGLGFPVGKSPKKALMPRLIEGQKNIVPFEIGRKRTFVPVVSPEIRIRKPNREIIGNLEQPRVNVALTPTPLLGKFPIAEQQRGIPPTIYPSAESPNVEKYGEPFDPLGFVGETETGFQARGQGQTLHLDLDTANLNLLDLKRTLAEKTYGNKGDTLAQSLGKQQAIKNAIAALEAAIPEETKTFFAQNETIIREALRTNQEARLNKGKLKSEQDIRRVREQFPEAFQSPSDVQPFIPETPVVKTGNETVEELMAGKAGDSNEGTSQKTAAEYLQDFYKITNHGQRGSFSNRPLKPGEGIGALTKQEFNDILRRSKDKLDYLSAFFIEDIYHRGIEPTLDNIGNQLKNSIGGLGQHLSDDLIKDSFNAGMAYYNANNADPFFSRMKQHVAENMPSNFTPVGEVQTGRVTPERTVTSKEGKVIKVPARDDRKTIPAKTSADQVREFLAQFPQEFAWTAGMDEFLEANKDKRISKKELIDVINRGQVRVEESVKQEWNETGENKAIEAEMERIKKRHSEIRDEIFNMPGVRLQTEANEMFGNNPEVKELNNRLQELSKQQHALAEGGVPQYSLRRYTGEKLELPGAVNSKEVLLITPLEYPLPTNLRVIKGAELNEDRTIYKYPNGATERFAGANENDAIIIDEKGIVQGVSFGGGEKGAIESYRNTIGKPQIKYKGPHYSEQNYVAHYRANDRTFIDKITGAIKRLYHSEEFQSDWNHDIRVKGLKDKEKEASFNARMLAAGEQLSAATSRRKTQLVAITSNPEFSYITGSSINSGNINKYIDYVEHKLFNLRPEGKYNETKEYLYELRSDLFKYKENLKQETQANDLAFNLGSEKAQMEASVEPNPFMSHNWKELVLKRFIRDAVVAKDENYPYTVEPNKANRPGKFSIRKADGYYLAKDGKAATWDTKEEAEQYLTNNNLRQPYKYDAVSWTTARQQMERYGKILESKNFNWKKEADGTYTFGITLAPDGEYTNEGYSYPHELSRISLKRFAELTTPEAADFVREQEAKLVADAREKGKFTTNRFIKDKVTGDFGEGDIYLRESPEEAVQSYLQINNELNGKFNLAEAVNIRKAGSEKYADYDVALVNMAKKIGKRFGAKYSKEEIITQPRIVNSKYANGYFIFSDLMYQSGPQTKTRIVDWVATEKEAEAYRLNNPVKNKSWAKANGDYVSAILKQDLNRVVAGESLLKQMQEKGFVNKGEEQVHSLEITPEMRRSLSKEGQPLYGLGSNDPLKNAEAGIRNSITTVEAFNRHRDTLVKSLNDLTSRMEERRLEEIRPTTESEVDIQNKILAADKPTLEAMQERMANKGTVFNSGLSPEAFIDQAKLLYKGFTEFSAFSKEMIERFGDAVKPFLQDLWIEVKDLSKSIGQQSKIFNFNETDWNGVRDGSVRAIKDDSEYSEDKITSLKEVVAKDGLLFAQIPIEGKPVLVIAKTQSNLIAAQKELAVTAAKKRLEDVRTYLDTVLDKHKRPYFPVISLKEVIKHNSLSDQRDLAHNEARELENFIAEHDTKKTVFNANEYKEGTGGTFNIGINPFRDKPKAEKKFDKIQKRTPYFDWYSMHRGIFLAQVNEMAGIVYDVARLGQRDKHAFEGAVLKNLHAANNLKLGLHQSVADNVLIGNENQRLFTDTELRMGDAATRRPALNPAQIQAYKDVYAAEHLNLDKRLQHVLHGYRTRAERLNDRLLSATPGTDTYTNILEQMANMSDVMDKIKAHYQMLKDTGYISLKRKGRFAAFVHDPAFPIGDDRGKIYRQFDSKIEAGKWIKEQEALYGADENVSDLYELNIPARLRAAATKLTPAQFEDLIDAAGVNSRSPEIESLRDEIYSRYPSTGYQLKRDNIRGYDRNWKFVLESVADQTEAYANSFYSRVAGEHMLKALDATNLQKDNLRLYKVMQKYVDHEISSPEQSGVAKAAAWSRKGVYLFQLGFDFNQLWLNAISQPATQTWSYFGRVEHNGQRLKGKEIDTYFLRGGKLAGKIAKDYLSGTNTADPEFVAIRNRLIQEGVVTAEFNKSLLEGEIQRTIGKKVDPNAIRYAGQKVEHWAGVFMRMGEVTTRTHVAAEAYLVGKEKFNLQGEELVNFMVRAIDATQTNPSRAEAPLLVRGSQNTGEFRKLFYQFNAFSHMWVENLALGVKADFKNRRLNATGRHLGAVTALAGVTGLPLSGIAAGLYTLITDEDPKEAFSKYMTGHETLENLALYGVTGHASISQKTGAQIPFIEDIGGEIALSAGQVIAGQTPRKSTLDIVSLSKIPAFGTLGQFTQGGIDIMRGDLFRGMGQALPFKPLRNTATTIRYNNEGIRTRGGDRIVSKENITPAEKVLQVIPGISPHSLTKHYQDADRKRKTTIIKKLRRKVIDN